MYPSANATIGNSARPSKVPVIITSMRPQNGTAAPSSATKDDDEDDEIDNEAKWAQLLDETYSGDIFAAWQMTTTILFIYLCNFRVVFHREEILNVKQLMNN